MAVHKDPDGRRWVSAEIEVPGTPEEVWEAIATGPGVTSWFVPTEIRDDGTAVAHFGPGFDVVARPLYSEPPRRFAGEGDMVPGGPKMATEWSVEARGGGRCVVRVVHSYFADNDDWDNQLDSFIQGWPDYFRVLTLYLTHHRGEPCSTVHSMAISRDPLDSAWGKLISPLGLVNAIPGDRRASTDQAPSFSGLIDRAGSPGHPYQFILRLDQPAPGLAHVFAMPAGPVVMLVVRLYLYGPAGAVVAPRENAAWHSWAMDLFPPPQMG